MGSHSFSLTTKKTNRKCFQQAHCVLFWFCFSIYEKLIQFCGIDELGTNYPKDMFDPHGWSEDSYYESLAKAQKVEMDKLEKAKKERTKIEFVTGTKKGTNPSNTAASTTSNTTTTTATADAQKRKSKWDS